MQFLRTLGYVVAAIVVISVLAAGGAFLATIVIIGTLIFWGSLLVGFVAYCIKEYWESKT